MLLICSIRARDHIATLMWVGDAFARPVLAALDANPGRWI